MYTLVKSAQSSTLAMSDTPMSRPPMVGVPSLAWWQVTSSRMCWRQRRAFSHSMSLGPSRMEITSAVSSAYTLRNVMYRKTLKTVNLAARG